MVLCYFRSTTSTLRQTVSLGLLLSGLLSPTNTQGCVWLIALPHDDSHREAKERPKAKQENTANKQQVLQGIGLLWKKGKYKRNHNKGKEARDCKVERSRAHAVAFSKRLLKLRSQLVNLNSHVGPEPTERFEVECLCEEVGNIEMSCNVGHS